MTFSVVGRCRANPARQKVRHMRKLFPLVATSSFSFCTVGCGGAGDDERHRDGEWRAERHQRRRRRPAPGSTVAIAGHAGRPGDADDRSAPTPTAPTGADFERRLRVEREETGTHRSARRHAGAATARRRLGRRRARRSCTRRATAAGRPCTKTLTRTIHGDLRRRRLDLRRRLRLRRRRLPGRRALALAPTAARLGSQQALGSDVTGFAAAAGALYADSSDARCSTDQFATKSAGAADLADLDRRFRRRRRALRATAACAARRSSAAATADRAGRTVYSGFSGSQSGYINGMARGATTMFALANGCSVSGLRRRPVPLDRRRHDLAGSARARRTTVVWRLRRQRQRSLRRRQRAHALRRRRRHLHAR